MSDAASVDAGGTESLGAASHFTSEALSGSARCSGSGR